ncbi:MAG: cupredoxin domain-containing protein [Thermomicrobiales bacterium]|nr:cupredoxin domain-containing protein [Thermomicrobiales bacterium]
MRSVRLGLVGALALALLGSGGAATLAQGEVSAPFQTGIYAGTCVDLGSASAAAYPLAGATYAQRNGAAAANATPGAAGQAGASVGPEDAIPVATSVTHIDASVEDLTNQPHALAVFSQRGGAEQEAVACGPIGGSFDGTDLVFGLLPMNDSGYSGIGWLNTSSGSGVTVTVFLNSLARTGLEMTGEMQGAMEMPAATPAASPAMETGAATATAAATETAATPSAAEAQATVAEIEAAAPAAAGEVGTPAAEAPPSVTVESVDINFVQHEITIPANTDVVINLPNNGRIMHNFSITDHKNPNVPNLGIKVNIQPGTTQHVTVNAPPGDYYYYCNIPGHEAAGMHGIMHVVG